MSDDENEEVVYPLKLKRKLWNKFKNLVPREINLNQALIELVQDKVDKHEQKK